jgi:glycosyltransferase involved in cell wall biosynthesis
MKMCQAFALLNHQVTLLAKKTTACYSVKSIYDFYLVRENFEVNISPKGAFKGSGLWYNFSLLWKLLNINADLIYTRSIIAAFLLLIYRKHVVFEVHEPFEGKGFRLRNMFMFIVKHKRLKKLVVISNALKNYYTSVLSVSERKLIVAHDASDTMNEISPLIINSDFKIGYVGSLLPGKGMEILLPLASICPAVKFHVVGGTPSQIASYKAAWPNLTNVIFHGFKSQQEIPGYLVSFDVLIAPYTQHVVVSEKGGANNLALWMSPLKLFEYMAAGKPIVTTSLPVILEILQHKKTAWLCSANNIDEWKEAIDTLQGSPELRRILANNAYHEFEEKYTWKKRAEWILQNVM